MRVKLQEAVFLVTVALAKEDGLVADGLGRSRLGPNGTFLHHLSFRTGK